MTANHSSFPRLTGENPSYDLCNDSSQDVSIENAHAVLYVVRNASRPGRSRLSTLAAIICAVTIGSLIGWIIRGNPGIAVGGVIGVIAAAAIMFAMHPVSEHTSADHAGGVHQTINFQSNETKPSASAGASAGAGMQRLYHSARTGERVNMVGAADAQVEVKSTVSQGVLTTAPGASHQVNPSPGSDAELSVRRSGFFQVNKPARGSRGGDL